MIGFFPELYEEELVYSWLARYMVYSGYSSVADSYLDLYNNKITRPSVEIMNNMPVDAIAIITKYKSLRTLVMENTMFPEYGRFISPCLRRKMLEECDFTKGNWSNNLMFPVSSSKRYLKYCPVCAEEDRERYGETYWHRNHQISNIRICTKHKVLLMDSSVVIERNNTRLKAAEAVVSDYDTPEDCKDDTINALAGYLEAVFESNEYSHDKIGLFLNERIDKAYIHDNGNRKQYELHAAYKSFYSSLSEHTMTADYMGKLLRGARSSFYNICQLAFFEGITTEELLEYQYESEEKRIFKVVADDLGESIEVVEKIGTAVLAEYKNHGGKLLRSLRYQQKHDKDDMSLLESIKNICEKMYACNGKRPRKVTITAVARSIGINPHKLKKYTNCMAVINSYHESQECYWAREIVWAVNEIDGKGEELNYRHIRDLINLKPENIKDSFDDLQSINEDAYKRVRYLM